jgi:predicted acetyltransferase
LPIEFKKIEKSERKVLENLMSAYLGDMSEFADFIKRDADGSYTYRNLHLYWQKRELSAFFILTDSEIIGFILSNRPPYVPDDCDISIQEFYIERKYRRGGLGREAAVRFLHEFPGRYFIAQLEGNEPAIKFWHSIYKDLRSNMTKDGK